ncbi:ABC-F family ATP-binding cassette domain-containing protein [Sporosarcina aquimarina]|uniref:ABC-F family ATP-binding cassette domain-containing protein n=1 Tax=Sporosarcina aquimarina TaxID=114975 RepID=A0ABU4FY06_9BACL|nr:ABC-F family ATP-binding cassette domain-containing protein [Sporosarcina aquimarina]MDW0109591.1 ABC-F family ATP-binding cassette domain-containing protein [Sporosarcina aquimarina]
MSQLIIENLTKTVGDKTLFRAIDFTITSGEKTGLLGINGTGKSTLLSIISGQEEADTISKDHPNNYRIAYLPQDPIVNPSLTVLEAVFQSDAPVIRLNLDYEHALQALTDSPEVEENQARFAKYQNQMDEQNAWDINTQARTILSKLGIETYDKKIGELSGGQRKRVMLAKTLIEPADLLLLDEPTNHLDVGSITWLQDFIKNLSGAVLFVTHDRYFLDAIATSIFELADQRLYAHKGNYGDFIEARALREEMNAATEDKLKNRYRAELKWIRRGAKARSTKQKARIGRFEDLEQQVKSGVQKEEMDAALKTSRLGKKVIEAKEISKSFNGKTVINQFSTILQSGDRIAVVGPNGAGKTTLVNMFDGILEPDEGVIERGTTVKIAYFKQHLPEMKETQRIIEYIRETSNDIEDGEGNRISASQMLERFLFPASAHGTPIGKLSGGERKRLYLLKLLMEQPNVLLLDEPTNDLDLETLSVLESFIDTFPGVVLTISHDRFFLDRTSTKLWVLDGAGGIETLLMSYTDFLETERIKEPMKTATPVTEPKEPEPAVGTPVKKKPTYKEKRDWETIEKDIEDTETAISTTEIEMTTCSADYERLNELTQKLDALNAKYEQLIERWSELEEIMKN